MKYPIAPNGIFRSFQGEGAMLGVPMAFVRLAGCSVGCPECDTDYRVAERPSVAEITARVQAMGCRWTWVTGGEPADHDLTALMEGMRLCGHIALATSGHKPIGAAGRYVDFLSLSPHDPAKLTARWASEVKIVSGLNGFRVGDFAKALETVRADHYFACPLYDREHRVEAESLRDCMEWIRTHPEWRLGVQAHKEWGLA